jgi:hypothetical protein
MLPLKKREGIRELCGRPEQQVMMVALPRNHGQYNFLSTSI